MNNYSTYNTIPWLAVPIGHGRLDVDMAAVAVAVAELVLLDVAMAVGRQGQGQRAGSFDADVGELAGADDNLVLALAPDEEVEACHDDHCTNHTESKIEMISLVYME